MCCMQAMRPKNWLTEQNSAKKKHVNSVDYCDVVYATLIYLFISNLIREDTGPEGH